MESVPNGPGSGLKGSFLFLKIVYFLFLGEATRGVWHVNEPKKDGRAQLTGAHARSKFKRVNRILC